MVIISSHFESWLLYFSFSPYCFLVLSISVVRISLMGSMLFLSSANILMIVALNSDQVYYLYLFWLDPWPWPFLFFSFGMNSSILAFCVGLCLLCVRKLVMFPAPKSNGFMKKRPYAVQGLPLQEVSLVYAACTLLLCFGCSFPQVSPLQSFSLPAVGSVWTLARAWQVLIKCALVCLLKET